MKLLGGQGKFLDDAGIPGLSDALGVIFRSLGGETAGGFHSNDWQYSR